MIYARIFHGFTSYGAFYEAFCAEREWYRNQDSAKPLQIILLYGSFRIFPGTSGARLFMTSTVSEISFDAMSYPDRKRGDCSPLWNFTLCKPCSVSGRPDGSHLSEPCGSSGPLRFASRNSPTKFGFLACGAYRVPPGRFPAGFVTVTLYGTSPWD